MSNPGAGPHRPDQPDPRPDTAPSSPRFTLLTPPFGPPVSPALGLPLGPPSSAPARITLSSRVTPSGYGIQGTLALDLPGGRPGLPETPELEPPGPARLPHVADAEVRAWAARLAQAVVEAVGGQRPVSQLIRWTSPAVYRDLERRVQLVRLAGHGTRTVRPQVRSVHVCRPSIAIAEVSVHVRHAGRSRAIAMRMERTSERWQCTVLEFG